MTLTEIRLHPTVIDNNHESLYKIYHILDYVLGMIDRGDSKETIFSVVEDLRTFEIDVKKTKLTNDPS